MVPMRNGVLAAAAPRSDAPDRFICDPMNPVPSDGGHVCCTGNAVEGGAFDQRGMEVSGPVSVTLYVSSDAKDTDFTAKLLDVYPDGTAYNLDETIQRFTTGSRLPTFPRAARQGSRPGGSPPYNPNNPTITRKDCDLRSGFGKSSGLV